MGRRTITEAQHHVRAVRHRLKDFHRTYCQAPGNGGRSRFWLRAEPFPDGDGLRACKTLGICQGSP